MKKVNDGWHEIAGYDVYIVGGRIIRGVNGEGCNRKAVWLYKWSTPQNAWSHVGSMPIPTFYKGIKKGYVKFF